jgi:hypothetical protein
MTVVTPLALVLSIVIDFSTPDPLIVVPLGRFEHVADESVKLTGNVSINGLAPAGRAVTIAMTKTAGAKATRLIEEPPPSPQFANSRFMASPPFHLHRLPTLLPW